VKGKRHIGLNGNARIERSAAHIPKSIESKTREFLSRAPMLKGNTNESGRLAIRPK
jgi:hypothetical protein